MNTEPKDNTDLRGRRFLEPGYTRSLVDEFPCVGTIETANTDCSNQLGIEVPKIHTVLAARSWLQRLPVGHAPAALAMDCPQSSVSPDVLCGSFRMAFDLH